MVNTQSHATAGLVPPPLASSALPTRSATELQNRTCASCLVEKSSKEFPRQTPTPSCEHPVSTCIQCMQIWIYTCNDTFYQPKGSVTCPDCDEVLLCTDVGEFATVEDMDRFWYKYDRIVKNMNPDMRFCLRPDCPSAQKHTSPAPNGSLQLDIFTCDNCNAKACVTCDRPWHDGMDCLEYAQSHMAQLVTEAFDRKIIYTLKQRGVIKPCPQCSCPIEKDGQSDNVRCTRCLYTFLWTST